MSTKYADTRRRVRRRVRHHVRRNARAPIAVSQNFLTAGCTIRRIVSIAKLSSQDHVLEIGPGKGHITRELIKHCGSLTAVELDRALYERLQTSYKDNKRVRLWHGDFLRMSLPDKGVYKIFANIPFSVTTDIVLKITEAGNPPIDAWLVMEKGAAKRFIGGTGTANTTGVSGENRRSLALKPFFDCRILYYFKRDDFHPTPSVDVVLLHINRKAKPDLPFDQRKLFTAFIRERLARRRTDGEILYIEWLTLFRRCNVATSTAYGD